MTAPADPAAGSAGVGVAVDVRAYGDAAVLVEPAGPVLALRDLLADHDWVDELVPAARTLLVCFDPGRVDAATAAAAVRSAAARVRRRPDASPPPDAPTDAAAPLVELPVRYDGADLDAVAREIGASTPALIARHSAATYTVAFCGFAPGFAYLTGLDPALWVPRLSTPRRDVAGGSVGIAGEYTGVYPRPSPGGWRLLGCTDAPLWDAGRTPPALLAPGTRVRFVPA